MINQTRVQEDKKTKQTLLGAIPLCSQCIIHEISNWVADKHGSINVEASQGIREELKDIKLKPGECVVCNHNLVSDNTFQNILKMFDKHKVSEELAEEFKRLFGFLN